MSAPDAVEAATDVGSLHGAVIFIINMVSTPFVLCAVMMLLRRRHLQPIKSRHPFLVALGSSLTILWGSCDSILRSFPVSCFFRSFLGLCIVPMILACYLTRAVDLLSTFKMIREKLAVRKQEHLKASELPQLPERPTVKALNSWAGHSLYLVLTGAHGWAKFLGTLALLHSLNWLLVLRSIEAPAAIKFFTHCFYPKIYTICAALVVFGYGAILVKVSLKLRIVEERLGLKYELKMAGFNALIGVLHWLPAQAIPAVKQKLVIDYPVTAFLLQINIHVFHLVSLFYPLYLSYRIEEKQKFQLDTAEDLENLKHLLNTTEGMEAFYDFLALEFAVENLMFWEETNEFKAAVQRRTGAGKEITNSQKAMCYNMALNVFTKYVSLHSPSMVNLPGSMVASIARRLNVPIGGFSEDYFENASGKTQTGFNSSKVVPGASRASASDTLAATLGKSSSINYVSPRQMKTIELDLNDLENVFDQALVEIFNLMKRRYIQYLTIYLRDSFARFQQTQAYEDLVLKLKENESHNQMWKELSQKP